MKLLRLQLFCVCAINTLLETQNKNIAHDLYLPCVFNSPHDAQVLTALACQ